VGRLSGNSLEGSGLSISVTPKAWRRIAKLGGSSSYILSKENPRFADGLDPDTRTVALAWCSDEGLLEKAKTWLVEQTDEDGEIRGYITFFSLEEALEEIGEDDPEMAEGIIEEADGWRFSEKGGKYFSEDARIPHQIAADYAVILWAEASGFDGVWWEEDYDPSSLSAPRGVIFQGRLGDWTISRGSMDDEDYLDADEEFE
jgi:hypothetical protein